MRIKRVNDIAAWRLCLGCGACAYICPDRAISLVDVVEEGVRPVINERDCGSCRDCLDVCPAFENDHTGLNERPGIISDLVTGFGPVVEVWEGNAVDPDIRTGGSSGGLLTALSLFCLERQGMHGVLHIGADSADPIRNKTQMSQSRADLLGRSGSRYAPASACDSLHLIESAPAPCVFIGQPSEVTALRNAERLRPSLSKKVGVAMSFFCAGSPARLGTIELLKSMGVKLDEVSTVRYRGNGWPGMFAVTLRSEQRPSHFRTYKESWSFVQRYRPLSTHLCPDGSGEDADISCGDPWYRDVQAGEAGSSLVVVRTETGRRIVHDAMEAGYVTLRPAEPWKVLTSQKNLVDKRGAIWGRVATLRAFGLPAPKLKGFSLFENWARLSLREKLRSTLGTARRIIRRNYYMRLECKNSLEGKKR